MVQAYHSHGDGEGDPVATRATSIRPFPYGQILPDEQGRSCGELDEWGELMPAGVSGQAGSGYVRANLRPVGHMIQNASQTAPAAYPPMTSLMK